MQQTDKDFDFPAVSQLREISAFNKTIKCEWHQIIQAAYQSNNNQSLTNSQMEKLSFAYLQDKYGTYLQDESSPFPPTKEGIEQETGLSRRAATDKAATDKVPDSFNEFLSLDTTILSHERTDLKNNYRSALPTFYTFLTVYSVLGAAAIVYFTAVNQPTSDYNPESDLSLQARLEEIKVNANKQ